MYKKQLKFSKQKLFKMPNNIFKKIKDAKKIFDNLQNKLKEQKINVETGAGFVKVTIDGNLKIIDLNIDNQLIKLKDKKLLEDLIISAVNEAIKKAMSLSQDIIQNTIAENIKKDEEDF